MPSTYYLLFFFTYTTTTEIYTLSLHDALPISRHLGRVRLCRVTVPSSLGNVGGAFTDRKSTRLNSSHLGISYAVFCLKKKTYLACCVSVLRLLFIVHELRTHLTTRREHIIGEV